MTNRADLHDQRRRVLFLMSDTGGGHRAAARSIQAAMNDRYPDQYRFSMVDVFRCCTPFPYKYMPEFYPIWVTYSAITWQFGYMLTDGRWRSRLFLDAAFFTWRKKLEAMFEHEKADIVVCVHSLFNRAALRVLSQHAQRPPFITVVTDLVSTPVSWYQPKTDRCLVPTDEAYARGLDIGMPAEKMQVTGLPVHPDFINKLQSKAEARDQLGWYPDKMGVLLVSGGDGMGPVYETVQAINAAGFDIQLAIVAGRNERLKRQLNSIDWRQPTYIYPFVDYMATLMAAADIIITKAGPATITEASVAGLPMILSGRVPGQEDGNVRLVINKGAGVFAPKPERVVHYLRNWINAAPEVREGYSKAAQQLSRPDAAWVVAEEIHRTLETHLEHNATQQQLHLKSLHR